MLRDDCSLIVMSCDKYSSAWYPFFELLKRNWKSMPKKIILSTETKNYSHEGLNIVCKNDGDIAWSNRLYNAVEMIDTEYLILSLEDFFMQSKVKDDIIEKCYQYMKEHEEVAQCRFKNCDNDEQIAKLGEEVFEDFYLAGNEVIFRIDTQIALWRKEALLSFIKLGENPWQFETLGTKRALDSCYSFLWYKSKEDKSMTDKFVVPYQMQLNTGYGISMGRWLWNNSKLFKDNNIAVDLSELGVYSKFQVKYNLFKNLALYQNKKGLIYGCFKLVYRLFKKICR